VIAHGPCARPESASANSGRANIPKGARFAVAALPLHPDLLAHGGVGGAIVEALVVVAVAGVFVAVWLRERGRRGDPDAPARLRDEDDPAR